AAGRRQLRADAARPAAGGCDPSRRAADQGRRRRRAANGARRCPAQALERTPAIPEREIDQDNAGRRWRPFARVMSPLGRLLDFLAHRYRVLFLVSAGNVMDRLVIPDYATSREFEDADPEEREKAVLAALNANKSQRTLFSPAEAMNALTIGAAHKSAVFNGGLPVNLI